MTLWVLSVAPWLKIPQQDIALSAAKMWAPYGTNGDVVQNWTSNTSAAWGKFDQQVTKFGKPSEVWIMICILPKTV